MDQGLEQDQEISLNGQQPAWKKPSGELGVNHVTETEVDPGKWHGLRGLLIAQIFGQFNDQAFKQLVILLAMAAVVGEAEKQERIAIVTMVLLIPLTIVSLPAGVLADRMSKRSVLIAMKALELVLMLAGAAALFLQSGAGWISFLVLGLVGVQTAFFVPAKYGILPEILPHDRLSAGNGLLEMTSNPGHAGRHRGGRDDSGSSPRPAMDRGRDTRCSLGFRLAGVVDNSTGQGGANGGWAGNNDTPGLGVD